MVGLYPSLNPVHSEELEFERSVIKIARQVYLRLNETAASNC